MKLFIPNRRGNSIRQSCSNDIDDASSDDWEDINSGSVVSSDLENGDDSDNSDMEPQVSLQNRLAKWVNAYQVKHNAVDDLLKILQRHCHPDFPSYSSYISANT